jgi:hypothetical protein
VIRHLLTVCVALLAAADVRALVLELKPADVQRVLALARWPHTDAERARFHARYFFLVNGPTVEYFAVQRVEVITEYRRLELIAEEHARMNDLFGRGGLRDVEEAMQPGRGRLTIVVYLTFDPSKYITGVPEVRLAMDGSTILLPIEISGAGVFGGGNQPVLTGARIEAVFDARAVGQETRRLSVYREGKEIARVPIEFAKLE